ncbi:hypothetical protein [Oscillatoria acuminata]|uniref:Uncharacterized protein n=1 Tax=Oscillatoria acuminata PCC 6304 TaxID=56110 RepID=K9THW5_9CYAN|nr:hypothetical protein [Oscillatoria acuminata]AFY82457.1 hypothetical protein Oscil6304_2855 [Oscillatoria acuminata PCC 6304]
MSKVKVYRPSQPSPKPNSDAMFWVFYLAAIIFGGMVTWMAVRSHFNVKDYQQGYEAYKTANCAEAIPHFKRITSRWLPVDVNQIAHRSETRINECEAYQKALTYQEKGHLVSSLITYNSILARYIGTELRPSIQKKASEVFTQNEITKLTDPKLCNQLEPFQRHQIFEKTSQKLPLLYQACANQYHNQGEYSQAVVFYEQFLQLYPQHQLRSDVEIALFQTLIAEAEAKGAREIAQPPAVGETLLGYTEVEIQNDSPTTLRFMFAGAERSSLDMKPCPECQIYKTQEEKPEGCPNKGPVQQFKLKPGDYEIVVNSVGKVRTIPFRGQWNLEDGVKYRICFIVVDFPIADNQNDLPEGDRIPADRSEPNGDSELRF